MNMTDSDLGCLLLCEVCEGEIMLLDDVSDTGCCAACGIAYVFDPVVTINAAAGA